MGIHVSVFLSRGRSGVRVSYIFSLLFQGQYSMSNPAAGGGSLSKPPGCEAVLQFKIWIIAHPYSPNLFCIVDFDLGSLFHELRVFLHKFDPPLRMLLQVVKLILQKKKRRNVIKSHTDRRKEVMTDQRNLLNSNRA